SHILAYDRGTLESTPVEDVVSIPFPEGFITRTEDFGARVSLGSLPLALVGIALALNLLPHPLAPSPTRLERGNRLAERNWLGGEASRWFWLALSVPPLILSAGGSITVAGVEIPLPYRALHAILGGMFRYPERFAPVFLIAAGVFALQTLTPLLVNRPVWRRVIPAALVLLVLVDARVLKPFPIQPQPPEYNFYAAMGREPYQYVVVEAPTGVSTGEGLVGEAVYATTQFYGLIHGKRMVNGHFSRVDSGHYWYLRTDDVLLSWLGQRRLLEPEQAADRLRAIIYGYPVGYIVVHTDWIDRYTGRSTTQEVVGYLNSLPELVCPVAVEDTAGKIAIAYRTAWHPDDCPARTPPEIAPGVYQIDVGNLDDAGFLGWGWHWREEIVPGLTARWTGQLDQADLYVELPRGVYTITLAAQSFNQARDLRILANGELLGTVTVPAEGLAELRVDLPAELTGDFLTLTLDYDAPEPVAGGADRDLAVMVDWVRFEQVGTVEPGP
ncbi:MAG: hypothetical protein JXQ72_02050, partial [Anaerolineae bacterium]|nr:hypothetical protein [Anaerolineae bacterium]